MHLCACVLAAMGSGCFTTPTRPTGSGSGSGSGGNGVPPNVAFVTSDVRPVTTITSLEVADRWCAEAAANATEPLAGTFVAWMSSETMPARNRFNGARGWVRVDGKPFIDQIGTALEAHRIFYPLRIDENGDDVYATGAIQQVATGTDAEGALDFNLAGTDAHNCDHLSGGGSMRLGYPDAAGSEWTAGSLVSCSSAMMHLYCFGTDRVSQVDPPIAAGPRIFISDRAISGGAGRDAFDSRCAADATAASLPGQFRAVVADNTTSAMEHVGAAGQTWTRIDGVEVTADLRAFQAPISVTAAGSYVARGQAWNGAMDPASLGTPFSTCANWTVGTFDENAQAGDAIRSTPAAFGGRVISCQDAMATVYCAEVQQR